MANPSWLVSELKRSFGTVMLSAFKSVSTSADFLHCSIKIASSIKARVSVFYNTFSTVVLHCPVAGDGDPRHVLDVEVLETTAVLGDRLHPAVAHQGTALDTQLLEVGAVLGEELEAEVGDITLSNVERPEPGAGPTEPLHGRVTDLLTAPDVEVPQPVAVPGQAPHPGVRQTVALGHREVPE